jgi:hypothetical protein
LPLVYIVTGWFGLLLAPPGYATAVFLPTGIILGSSLLNLWIGYLIAGRLNLIQVAAALVIATGSMTQTGIGGTMLRRTVGYPTPFDNSGHVLVFFLLTPIFCLTSGTISLGGLWVLGVFELPDLPTNGIPRG